MQIVEKGNSKETLFCIINGSSGGGWRIPKKSGRICELVDRKLHLQWIQQRKEEGDTM
jgi:hypothetical protein